MTLEIENGWAQWDYQIGTFRADINGKIFGLYTGDINTAAELAAVILPTVLTAEQILDLEAEKQAAETENQEGIL